MRPVKTPLLLVSLLFLSACGDGADAPMQAQRISLDAARHKPAQPALSPDTKGARWSVTGNAQAIAFGREGAEPWLTLACDVRGEPASLTIIRHTPARPGEKAMFPVLGNGTISRFKVDAALADGEWRWEGRLAASDPQLDVFTGPRELEATLPGGGTLLIGGSRIPGEFVNWCRAGGRLQRVEAAEADAAAASPSPARPISSVLPGR